MHIVSERDVVQMHARLDHATAADARLSLDRDERIDDRVRSDRDQRIDDHRRRIAKRHAVFHQPIDDPTLNFRFHRRKLRA